jgi:FtsP/CotA-like multicopper oxidase with cupredoxin domain
VVQSPIIAKGQTVRVAFAAPRAGTYIYLDPENAPMNRVMGLNGVLVVLPDPQRSNTPYSDNTPAVQQLFDMLGTTEIFPGDPWALEKREWLWVFHGLDSSKNELVRRNPELTAEEFLDGALTDYHLISGKSGFFAAHDPNIFPHGNIGQPALIRSVGTGLVTQSPHIHGNHVYQVAVDGVVQDNPFSLDTWTVRPMSRVDVLLPFETPPDAHPWPPSNIREFPMPFTMHCHIEMSQTATGGNYPQGSVTDWEITSPQVGGPEAPEEEFPFFRGMDPDLFRA